MKGTIMKSIIALMLALLMVLAVSCGRATDEDETDTTESASATEGTSETEPATENTTENSRDPEPDGEGSTPLLYKATDADGSCVWLMGTIHLGSEEFYPFPGYVNDAYNSSDSLAVEADVIAFESDFTAQYNALMTLVYMDGTDIKDHISEELYNAAKGKLEELGMYNSAFDVYEPALWWQTITALMYQELELDTTLGVDYYFLTTAKEDDKPIHEIESAQIQYQMFSDFSEDLQIFLLESVVNLTPEIIDRQLTAMSKVWTSGEENAIENMVMLSGMLGSSDDALDEEYYTAMIAERNVTMTDFAEGALKDDEEVFICVGMGHVAGDGGMVDLLRERGYTVEIVK